MLTGAQIRAGRALVKWTAAELAERAKLGRITVTRAEQPDGETPLTQANAEAIRRVLEDAGVVFIPEDGGGSGVRLKHPAPAKEPPRRGRRAAATPAALALLLSLTAGAAPVGPAEPPQACLSPAEMAALLPASREQAEDWCEDGDARALGRVRVVLRLLGTTPPTPDATTDTAE